MGLAFITRTLDQWKQFDSLHWFESVENMSRAERDELTQQMQESKKKKSSGLTAEEYQHRMKLNQQRLMEFELLNYSINSARVFFITDEGEANKEEEKKEEAPSTGSTAEPADSAAAPQEALPSS